MLGPRKDLARRLAQYLDLAQCHLPLVQTDACLAQGPLKIVVDCQVEQCR